MRIFTAAVALLVVFNLGAENSFSSIRKDKPKKPAKIVPYKITITPRLTVGLLQGKAKEYADQYIPGMKNQLIYGGGILVEDYLKSNLALGFSFQAIWKNIPDYDFGPGRGYAYSVSSLYKHTPNSCTSLFGRLEIGLIKVSLLNYSDSTSNLDSHLFHRLGLGVSTYTSTGTSFTFEVYYRVLHSNGYETDLPLINQEVNFNLSHYGVELGITIPIMKRSP